MPVATYDIHKRNETREKEIEKRIESRTVTFCALFAGNLFRLFCESIRRFSRVSNFALLILCLALFICFFKYRWMLFGIFQKSINKFSILDFLTLRMNDAIHNTFVYEYIHSIMIALQHIKSKTNLSSSDARFVVSRFHFCCPLSLFILFRLAFSEMSNVSVTVSLRYRKTEKNSHLSIHRHT